MITRQSVPDLSSYVHPFSVELMTHGSVRNGCILYDEMKTIRTSAFAGLANANGDKTLHAAMIYRGVRQIRAK